MDCTLVKIPPLSTWKVTFYTVQLEGKAVTEYEDFDQRLSADPANEEELNEIQEILDMIGKRGAKDRYFNRHERSAYALPPRSGHHVIATPDYGIRLYCLRITDHIVILLNGDRKKTQKANEAKSGV